MYTVWSCIKSHHSISMRTRSPYIKTLKLMQDVAIKISEMSLGGEACVLPTSIPTCNWLFELFHLWHFSKHGYKDMSGLRHSWSEQFELGVNDLAITRNGLGKTWDVTKVQGDHQRGRKDKLTCLLIVQDILCLICYRYRYCNWNMELNLFDAEFIFEFEMFHGCIFSDPKEIIIKVGFVIYWASKERDTALLKRSSV